MFKVVAFVAGASAINVSEPDFVERALASKAVDNLGNPTEVDPYGRAKFIQLDSSDDDDDEKKKKEKNTSDYHGAYVTPALLKRHLRAGQVPAVMGYKVPDFGQDFDIAATQKHAAESEKLLGHKWRPEPASPPYNPDLRMPNFGMDRDILDAQSNLKNTEKELEHNWNPEQDANGAWIVPTAFDAHSYSYKGH